MANSPAEPGDPVMIVLTGLLRLGPMKVSRILPNKKAVGFMLPVVASLVAVFFAAVGALIGMWFTSWFGGFDLILGCAAIGGLVGYLLVTARIDGKPVINWFITWFTAKTRGRVEVNGRPIKLVTLPVKSAPPKNSTVLAASNQTIVYAVPAHTMSGTSEVYLGVAPLQEVMLGSMVLADSTIPERPGQPALR